MNENLVLKMDENQETIPSVLGISNERAKELIELCRTSLKSTDTFTESIKEVSEKTETLEELAFICFELGMVIGVTKGMRISTSPLASLVHQMMQGGSEE